MFRREGNRLGHVQAAHSGREDIAFRQELPHHAAPCRRNWTWKFYGEGSAARVVLASNDTKPESAYSVLIGSCHVLGVAVYARLDIWRGVSR